MTSALWRWVNNCGPYDPSPVQEFQANASDSIISFHSYTPSTASKTPSNR